MIVDNMDGQMKSRHGLKTETAASRRRDGRAAIAGAALLALALAGGCGASRPIKYYQLTSPADVAPATAQSVPVTIIVRSPVASDLYRDNRIVYGIGDQQLGSYEYQRWVGPPAELIQTALLRDLRSTGHYQGVFAPQAKVRGDYALVSRIYDFKEQDSGSTLAGRLSMDVELRNLKTGDTVWQTYYTHDEPISAKTVPDVVSALNRNVQLAANNIASGLDQYFASHPLK